MKGHLKIHVNEPDKKQQQNTTKEVKGEKIPDKMRPKELKNEFEAMISSAGDENDESHVYSDTVTPKKRRSVRSPSPDDADETDDDIPSNGHVERRQYSYVVPPKRRRSNRPLSHDNSHPMNIHPQESVYPENVSTINRCTSNPERSHDDASTYGYPKSILIIPDDVTQRRPNRPASPNYNLSANKHMPDIVSPPPPRRVVTISDHPMSPLNLTVENTSLRDRIMTRVVQSPLPMDVEDKSFLDNMRDSYYKGVSPPEDMLDEYDEESIVSDDSDLRPLCADSDVSSEDISDTSSGLRNYIETNGLLFDNMDSYISNAPIFSVRPYFYRFKLLQYKSVRPSFYVRFWKYKVQ